MNKNFKKIIFVITGFFLIGLFAIFNIKKQMVVQDNIKNEKGKIQISDDISKDDEKESKKVISSFIENTLNPYRMNNRKDVDPNSKIFMYYLEKRSYQLEQFLKESGITKENIKKLSVENIDYKYFNLKDGVIDTDINCFINTQIQTPNELIENSDEESYLIRLKKINGNWKVVVATRNVDKNNIILLDDREKIDIYSLISLPFNDAKNSIDNL